MPESDSLPGIIVRAQSGFFTVMTSEGGVVAQLRGRLKRPRRLTDVAALGDRVRVTRLDDGSGVIETIEERSRVLSRRAALPWKGSQRDIEQVIVANPDQAVFVFACADPDPNFRMLDRFLVVAESQSLPAVICANKLDLVVARDARREFGEYAGLGYPVVYTSAKTGKGVDALREVLTGRLSVLAGPSGVGKSSLLNLVQPGLGLATREVQQATGKGKHMTVVPELIPLQGGGYVADTPGLKALDLWDIEPSELDAYFPEIRPLVAECGYSDCSHLHEPGCAVLAAVAAGRISPERYDSYCRIRLGRD
jgi:ribosome biogenesis GTPase / thiamine phosphate phosphatase